MPHHILLVDDNASLLATLRRSLRDLGYSVTSTDSGADALCLLSSQRPPDLVVLDLVMTGMDGYAVIRGLGPTAPPVVVMTGSDIDESQFQPARVARVLTKPFTLASLLEAISTGLSQRTTKRPEDQKADPEDTREEAGT